MISENVNIYAVVNHVNHETIFVRAHDPSHAIERAFHEYWEFDLNHDYKLSDLACQNHSTHYDKLLI